MDFIKTKNGIFKELAEYIETTSGEPEVVKINHIIDTFKNISSEPIESFSLRSVLNPGEEQLYTELKSIIKKEFDGFELGVKVRVADVVLVEPELIGQELFHYSLMAHFDFVIFDSQNQTKPVLAIELDGKTHRNNSKTIKNDKMKDKICNKYGLNMIRISTDTKTTVNNLRDYLSRLNT